MPDLFLFLFSLSRRKEREEIREKPTIVQHSSSTVDQISFKIKDHVDDGMLWNDC